MNVQEIRGRLNMMTDEQKDKLLKMLDPVWEKEQRALLEQIPGWKEACEADDESEEAE